MLKRKFGITIEGLIGSGKTTLLNKIEQCDTNSNFMILHEPVEDFKSCKLFNHEYNPLKEFYYDRSKNSVAFQCWVNQCYNKQLENISDSTSENTNILMDRCFYSSVVFIKTLNRLKVYSDFTESFLESQVLSSVEKFYGKNDYGVDKIYYLNTPIDVCIQNILKRDRSEEKNVHDLERYLTLLDIEYKLFLYDFIKMKGIENVRVFYHPDIQVVKNDFEMFLHMN